MPVLLFSAGASMVAYCALRHTLALRLDALGITLIGGLQPPGTTFVHWTDVREIVLSDAALSSRFGICRKSPNLLSQSMGTGSGSQKPDISTRIDLWRVDVLRLRESAHAYAPSVIVRDERYSRREAVEAAPDPANRRNAIRAIGFLVLFAAVIALVIVLHAGGASGS